MESLVFYPYEMQTLRKAPPLEWASDFLLTTILDSIKKNRVAVLESLRNTSSADVFEFNCVEWKDTARKEKRRMRSKTYREKKQICLDEIEENGWQHSIWSKDSTVSIHAVLVQTDFLLRLNAELGSHFEVRWTSEMHEDSPRIDFDINDPQYLACHCVIQIRYVEKETMVEKLQACRRKYQAITANTDTENIYLLNQAVRRHLKFDD